MADFNFVESMVGVPDLLLTHLPNMYGLDNYHYNHSHTAHQQWRIGHVGHAVRKEKCSIFRQYQQADRPVARGANDRKLRADERKLTSTAKMQKSTPSMSK